MKRLGMILTTIALMAASGCGGGESAGFDCADESCQSGDAQYNTGDDFSGVVSIDGDLSVSGVDSVDGLDSLETVAGNLIIVDTDLTDLSAFSNLRQVNGELHIAGNDRLESLAGLESVRSVGHLEVRRNASLTTLDGLAPDYLSTIRVFHNPRLKTFGSLSSVEEVFSLSVRYNVSLPAGKVGVRGTSRGDVIFNQPTPSR